MEKRSISKNIISSGYSKENIFKMNEIEKKEFIEIIDDKPKETYYINIRNEIISLWQMNQKEILNINEVIKAMRLKMEINNRTEEIHINNIEVIYKFLERYGYINFSIKKKEIEKKKKNVVIIGAGISGKRNF
jgi:hypothetical protein